MVGNPVYQYWHVKYQTNDTYDEGDVEFTINYSDTAGNPGIPITSTTDGTSVKFYKITNSDFDGRTGKSKQEEYNEAIANGQTAQEYYRSIRSVFCRKYKDFNK